MSLACLFLLLAGARPYRGLVDARLTQVGELLVGGFLLLEILLEQLGGR